MKKLLLSLLALGAVACQPQGRPVAATSPPAAAPMPAGRSLAGPALADSTAAVLALTRQVDLAPGWGNTIPHSSPSGAMEGFYGPDNYRISFYFDTLRRDPQQPNVFHFWGRDRYKKVITPFTGTLTVTRLAPLPDTVGLLHNRTRRAYSAFASFELREDPRARGAGWCRGRAALDFQLDARQQLQETVFDGIDLGADNPTAGCGLVFEGTWHDNRTGQQKPVSWANYYGAIVPGVLAEMGLGSRSEEIDPRLAKYGWNTLLENDEWWADSPKPRPTL